MSATHGKLALALGLALGIFNAAPASAQVRGLVAVNYSDHASPCFVSLPWSDLGGREWRLADLMGDAVYDRPGDDLASRGLYLDVPAWGRHVFDVEPKEGSV